LFSYAGISAKPNGILKETGPKMRVTSYKYKFLKNFVEIYVFLNVKIL